MRGLCTPEVGLSKNISYTFDPNAPQGSHITSVYIDGEPLNDDQVYKVVMPSFLAAGGDNFFSINFGLGMRF